LTITPRLDSEVTGGILSSNDTIVQYKQGNTTLRYYDYATSQSSVVAIDVILDAKPVTNTVEFDLALTNIVCYYQPDVDDKVAQTRLDDYNKMRSGRGRSSTLNLHGKHI